RVLRCPPAAVERRLRGSTRTPPGSRPAAPRDSCASANLLPLRNPPDVSHPARTRLLELDRDLRRGYVPRHLSRLREDLVLQHHAGVVEVVPHADVRTRLAPALLLDDGEAGKGLPDGTHSMLDR